MSGEAVFNGVLNAVGHLRAALPGLEPHTLKLSHYTYMGLIQYLNAQQAGSYGPHVNNLLGLALQTDDFVPAGVWRIHAADGTLLRDSRSTNPIMRGSR